MSDILSEIFLFSIWSNKSCILKVVVKTNVYRKTKRNTPATRVGPGGRNFWPRLLCLRHCYYHRSVFFSLFWHRRLCVRHLRWRLQCVAGHCYYHRSVFPLSFFSLRLLLLTHFRESPEAENLLSPIF